MTEVQHLVFPDDAFRAELPAPSRLRPFRMPPLQPFALPGGTAAYLVEQHALPIVSMDLSFDGGSVVDPPGQEGLAGLAMALVAEGTRRLDKLALSGALADTASTVAGYAADDVQGMSLASLTPHVGATFDLLAELLRAPGLRAADFERLQRRRIEAVRQARSNPSAIPGRVIAPVLYGPDHPFGAVVTEASLAAITVEACARHLATWLSPERARLFVVGDLAEAQVRELAARAPLVGPPGADGAPPPPSVPPPRPMPGRIFFVDVPGSPQATVMRMQPGPPRTAPDYPANTILAAVIGGGFTSRLNMNLREDKAYSYGARGGFSYGKTFGVLTVSVQVQAEAAYQTVLEIHRELEALRSGEAPVTSDELAREKTNAVLALRGRFATAQAALGQYRSLVYYGLPLDDFATYAERIGAVTEDQVARAAARHLGADEAAYLVVGDGAAPVIVDSGRGADAPAARRLPHRVGGRQLALREALAALAERGDVGEGALIVLDVDGRPLVERTQG
jgi:zinc protease